MPIATVFAAQPIRPGYHSRVRNGMVPILPRIGSMKQNGMNMPMLVDEPLPVRRIARKHAK
jgi:hypothetical protein